MTVCRKEIESVELVGIAVLSTIIQYIAWYEAPWSTVYVSLILNDVLRTGIHNNGPEWSLAHNNHHIRVNT